MSRTYFGTDGIRGTVGTAPITPDFMLHLGHAVGQVLKAGERRPTVLIGKDTRISGYMIESALEAGFASAGVDVLLTGPLPTPGVAYLTRALRSEPGRRHQRLAQRLSGQWHQVLLGTRREASRRLGASGRGGARERATLGRVGRPRQGAPARRRQRPLHRVLQEHLQPRSVPEGAEDRRRRRPRRRLSRRARRLPRARCRGHGDRLPARRLQHQRRLRRHRAGGAGRRRRASGADYGIALDGDADRLQMVDGSGRLYNGDELLYVLAADRLDQGGALPGVVGTR